MEVDFLGGRLLIAMPGIGDARFERALILICAHDSQHAMGVAVNRPVEGLTLPNLLEKLQIASTIEVPADLVRIGGPVEQERGFVLHTPEYHSDFSLEIDGGLVLTATREVLEAMVSHNQRPRRALLALGYAGWGAGQLESEIRHNVWLTVDADEALVFDDEYETKWSRAVRKLGIDPRFLSAEAGEA